MIIEYCLAGLGVALFAIGYFRKSRNFMLLGMIVLIAGLGWPDFAAGWKAAG